MIFDLKIGCVVTPRQLSNVFQYSFMRWKLGIDYIPNSYLYEIDTQNSRKIQVTGDQKIVYLGLGTWKVKD
ncbi:hypothetical protein [Lactobacillus crispatus]|jgi:hypothetical protein|uniref:hypothetical protein n=1 Tax=Lactobacillus crispatus TaxID=47770 RepID=UPI001F092609|nr:hypothetical protein [Lactobacillus crispatus]